MAEETFQKKRSRYILENIIIILLVGIISAGFTWAFFHKKYVENITILKKQHEKELGTAKQYIIREARLECMVKNLMIAYKLSKWEAYYLCVMFDDFSIRYHVPWEVFPAIIRVESNFNPSAKSPKNCFGLMQLKKSTGKEMADQLGIEFNDKITLWNDFVNVILGSTYLCNHINEEGLKNGVKSYLGGPDYKKSIKNNHGTRTYVKEYKTSVMSEYEQLALMFRGVVDELGYKYQEIYKIPLETDPVPLVFTLFADTADTTQ